MTTAGEVFAKASTQTVDLIAVERGGRRIQTGYVFPDKSVVRVDVGAIGYCASDRAEYPMDGGVS